MRLLQMLPTADAELVSVLQAPASPSQFGYGSDDRPTMIRTLAATGVAVIRVYGPILRRQSWWAASYPVLKADLDLLAGNAAVTAAVMLFDSPGGEAMGCTEACQAIDRFPKPIVAFAEGNCTSAAYRLACHCDQVQAAADAEIGNIGTRISIDDFSEANQMAGIRRFDFVTGWAKAIGSYGAKVTEQQQQFLQQWVVRCQIGFRDSLSRRKMTGEQIAKVSTGEWWGVAEAQSLKLIDGVSTLGEVVAKLGASPKAFPSVVQQGLSEMNKGPGQPEGLSANVSPLSSLSGVAPEQSAPTVQTQQQPTQQPAPGQQNPNPAAGQQSQQTQQSSPAASPVQQQVTPANPSQPQQSGVESQPSQQQSASPVAAAAATSQQADQNELPATYQQILDACEGVTPTNDFVVAQMQQQATPSQVRRNFIQALAASSSTASAPAGGTRGLSQAGPDSSESSDDDPSDPMQQLESAIQELMTEDKSLSRMQAARQVVSENPGMLTAFQEANRSMTPEQRIRRRQRNCGRILGTTFEPAR